MGLEDQAELIDAWANNILLLATYYPYPNTERDYIRKMSVISMSDREMIGNSLFTRLPNLHTIQS